MTRSTNSEVVVEELYEGQGNYEFDYFVQGIRLGYEDYEPIIENVDYVPFQGNHTGMNESETTTQEWYNKHSEGLKRIFMMNGTLDDDCKVNEELFEEQGWRLIKGKEGEEQNVHLTNIAAGR